MLISQFIESEYKCPVYDDSYLFLVPDSSVFITDVTDKSLITPAVWLQASGGLEGRRREVGGGEVGGLLSRLRGFITAAANETLSHFIPNIKT